MALKFLQRIRGAIRGFGLLHPYDAEVVNRDRPYNPKRIGPAPTVDTPSTREGLASKAEDLMRNSGVIRNIASQICTYTVGGGFEPLPLTPDEQWNTQAVAYWKRWARRADVTGRTLEETLRLAVRTMVVQGDAFFVLVNGTNGPKIQLLEGLEVGSDGTDTKLIDGVRLSSGNRPSAYSIRVVDPVTQSVSYYNVSSNNIAHLVEFPRPSSVRGISWFASGLNSALDISQVIAAERVAVKHACSTAAVRYTESGLPPSQGWDTELNADNEPEDLTLEQIYSGQIPTLRNGEKMELWQPNREEQQLVEFLKFLIHEISDGVGLPYGFVWDSSILGGASQRFVIASAQRRFEQIQQLVLRILDRLWGFVISVAIKNGELPEPPETYLDIRWQLPPALTVDYRSQRENREDMLIGSRTLKEDAAERGMDWKSDLRAQTEVEVDDLLERTFRLAQKYQMDPAAVLPLLRSGSGTQVIQVSQAGAAE